MHPGDTVGAREALNGLVPAPGRCLRRVSQRDLRCGSAVPPARLHRAGMERGGTPALVDQDGRSLTPRGLIEEGLPGRARRMARALTRDQRGDHDSDGRRAEVSA